MDETDRAKWDYEMERPLPWEDQSAAIESMEETSIDIIRALSD